jgi:hypothetical protein
VKQYKIIDRFRLFKKEMGLKRAAGFRLTVIIEIVAEYLGQALDTGSRVFGIQTILIYPIHRVILLQGNLAGIS